jgi:UDP-2-acetamido-2-deoxy-ribo-hexuluronate aminotransferase
MKNIQMVDLKRQYERLKPEIDAAIFDCIESSRFIKGPAVEKFETELKDYLNVAQVISCGNGTDALQLALMGLNLKPGDEVIIPAFTYAATAEVIGLLGLTPVLVDVNPDTFNIDVERVAEAITPQSKAIIPVHLFGQAADMEALLKIAQENNLHIIEDNAQAIGAEYTFEDGTVKRLGTIGAIGCTSFFPSKNLGCYGDGGAMMCNDPDLGRRLKMIANHGQAQQYIHDIIGVNSRLDTIQAGILSCKLTRLDEFSAARNSAADYYDRALAEIAEITTPWRDPKSTHVFHQYTLKVLDGRRDSLKEFLRERGVPSMVYYPRPLHHQPAYKDISVIKGKLEASEKLVEQVLSLPIHTEMTEEEQAYIVNQIKEFFRL